MQPASHASPIHVFFNANDAYAPHLSVVIVSILRNSKSDFSFHILTSDFTKETREKLLSLRERRPFDIEFVHVDKARFANVDRRNLKHLTMEAYYRLLAAEVRPQIDRAIYLDCDLVVNRDLRELWDIDIGSRFCAAVRDAGAYAPGMVEKIFHKKFYFNSGVLLLNLSEIRKYFSSEDFLRIKRENAQWFKYNDQDILNKAFGRRVVELPAEWNVTDGMAPDWVAGQLAHPHTDSKGRKHNIRHDIQIPAIMHYTRAHKPWKKPCGIDSQFFSWLYFRNLRETPYADLEKDMRENYDSARDFLRFWWRRPLFFLKGRFWQRRYYKHLADLSELHWRASPVS